jgi:serine/threonine-protein kinase
LTLAACYETNGQTASAWLAFQDAAAQAASQQDRRERLARERAAALERRLARLAVVVPGNSEVPGLEVRRDGLRLGQAEWGTAVPVDPGVHTVAASAPGYRPWSITVQLASRPDTLPVTIPVLAPEGGAAPGAPQPAPEAGSGAATAGAGLQRTVGLVVAGTGAIGLAIGTYFALSAKVTYDASNAGGHCLPDNECDPIGAFDRNVAKSAAGLATAMFLGGLAAIGGGGALYFTAPRARTVGVAVAPSPAGAAVRVSLEW